MSSESQDANMTAAAQRALAAVQNCLKTFPNPTGQTTSDPEAGRELAAFTTDAGPTDVYQLVAIAAAILRWASHETGRTESEIVAEFAKNYEQ